MVLRRVRRIDIIQDLETKDGVKVRVKSIIIAPRGIKSTIEKTMRKQMGELIKKEVEKSG